MRIVPAEACHKAFILETYNSDSFLKNGMRRLSQGYLEAFSSEGFYFHLDRGEGFLVALEDETHVPVGVVKVLVGQRNRVATINLGLVDRVQGLGRASEFYAAVTDFLFTNFSVERVDGNVLDFNVRSSKAFERVGYTLEGIKRKAWFCQGRLHDHHIYGITREDFVARKQKPETSILSFRERGE